MIRDQILLTLKNTRQFDYDLIVVSKGKKDKKVKRYVLHFFFNIFNI